MQFAFNPRSIRRQLQPMLLLLLTVKQVPKSWYFKHNNWPASQSLCLKISLSQVILFEHSRYCSQYLCVNINPVIYRIWAWITSTTQLLHFGQSRREASRVHQRVSRNQLSFMQPPDELLLQLRSVFMSSWTWFILYVQMLERVKKLPCLSR